MVRERAVRLAVPAAPALRGLHAPLLHGLPAGRARAGAGARAGARAGGGQGLGEANLHHRGLRKPLQVSWLYNSIRSNSEPPGS